MMEMAILYCLNSRMDRCSRSISYLSRLSCWFFTIEKKTKQKKKKGRGQKTKL